MTRSAAKPVVSKARHEIGEIENLTPPPTFAASTPSATAVLSSRPGERRSHRARVRSFFVESLNRCLKLLVEAFAELHQVGRQGAHVNG